MTLGSQSTSSRPLPVEVAVLAARAPARMLTTRSTSSNSKRCGTSASRSFGPHLGVVAHQREDRSIHPELLAELNSGAIGGRSRRRPWRCGGPWRRSAGRVAGRGSTPRLRRRRACAGSGTTATRDGSRRPEPAPLRAARRRSRRRASSASARCRSRSSRRLIERSTRRELRNAIAPRRRFVPARPLSAAPTARQPACRFLFAMRAVYPRAPVTRTPARDRRSQRALCPATRARAAARPGAADEPRMFNHNRGLWGYTARRRRRRRRS